MELQENKSHGNLWNISAIKLRFWSRELLTVSSNFINILNKLSKIFSREQSWPSHRINSDFTSKLTTLFRETNVIMAKILFLSFGLSHVVFSI